MWTGSGPTFAHAPRFLVPSGFRLPPAAILEQMTPRTALLSLVLLCSLAAGAPGAEEGNQPFPPFRIIGNIYYVGARDIASYLIVTPAGDFLLNTGYEDTALLIRASIQHMGFHLSDIRILLNSQAHFDHVAGQAAMQKWTGAKIYSSAADATVLETGGKTDPLYGKEHTFTPVKVDRIVRDGEGVTLGGVTLVAHLTPGHTRGCTTWTMKVADAGKQYDVVIVGGTSINPGVRLLHAPTYPGIADDFAQTFRVLRSLHCDIFLGAHGSYYGMISKRERQQAGQGSTPFLDPQGYRDYVDRAEQTYRAALRREESGK